MRILFHLDIKIKEACVQNITVYAMLRFVGTGDLRLTAHGAAGFGALPIFETLEPGIVCCSGGLRIVLGNSADPDPKDAPGIAPIGLATGI